MEKIGKIDVEVVDRAFMFLSRLNKSDEALILYYMSFGNVIARPLFNYILRENCLVNENLEDLIHFIIRHTVKNTLQEEFKWKLPEAQKHRETIRNIKDLLIYRQYNLTSV